MYYIIAIFFIILIFIVCLRFFKVKNLKFTDWIQVEFWQPRLSSKYHISTTDKLEPVISQDGKIYKIQLKTTFKGSEDTSINNAQLFIAGMGWFVIRLFFEEDGNGSRYPINKDRVLEKDKIHKINMEFMPRDRWEPLPLEEKDYKALLKIKLLDTKIKHRFYFKIPANILRTWQLMADPNQPQVVQVPILRN